MKNDLENLLRYFFWFMYFLNFVIKTLCRKSLKIGNA
jgi:hypothetical protein